jgi:hypothetical protein
LCIENPHGITGICIVILAPLKGQLALLRALYDTTSMLIT